MSMIVSAEVSHAGALHSSCIGNVTNRNEVEDIMRLKKMPVSVPTMCPGNCRPV
jgi:hypothetical protein